MTTAQYRAAKTCWQCEKKPAKSEEIGLCEQCHEERKEFFND